MNTIILKSPETIEERLVGGLTDVIYVALLQNASITAFGPDMSINFDYQIELIHVHDAEEYKTDQELRDAIIKHGTVTTQSKGYFSDLVAITELTDIDWTNLQTDDPITLLSSAMQDLFIKFCIKKNLFGIDSWSVL